MKNVRARVRAFNALLARRARIADQLRTQLNTQREHHARLAEAKEAAQHALTNATTERKMCDARIDEMTRSDSILLPEINAQRQYRETLEAQCALLARQLREREEALLKMEAEMGETRKSILRNERSVDVYRERIDAMEKDAERRTDEEAEEEAEESRTGRSFMAFRMRDRSAGMEDE